MLVVVKCLLQHMPKNLTIMTVIMTTRTLAGIGFLTVLKFLQKENDKSRDLESFIISLKNNFCTLEVHTVYVFVLHTTWTSLLISYNSYTECGKHFSLDF